MSPESESSYIIPTLNQVVQASNLNFLILSIHIRKEGLIMPNQRAVAKITKDNTDKILRTVAAHFGK